MRRIITRVLREIGKGTHAEGKLEAEVNRVSEGDGTVNVGTMTGKTEELVELMDRRGIEILCIQETKWKGSKAREFGLGYKLFYKGADTRRNGIGIIVHQDLKSGVIDVKRVSDHLMQLKAIWDDKEW